MRQSALTSGSRSQARQLLQPRARGLPIATGPRAHASSPLRAAEASQNARLRLPSPRSVRRRRKSPPSPTPAQQAPSAHGSDRKRPAASHLWSRSSPAADQAPRDGVPAGSGRVRVEPGSPCPSLRRPTDGTGQRHDQARRSAARWSVRRSPAVSGSFGRAPLPPCREWFQTDPRPQSTRPSWRRRARR